MKRKLEWELHPELCREIHYELGVLGDACMGDEENTGLIVEVLAELPEEVREDVLENVVFVHTLAWGTLASISRLPKMFIILNFKGVRSQESKLTTIAHEIAHYVLCSGDQRGGEEAERQADDLCKTWGFGRAYKSYKIFKPFKPKRSGQ
jgi:hypothetical protein